MHRRIGAMPDPRRVLRVEFLLKKLGSFPTPAFLNSAGEAIRCILIPLDSVQASEYFGGKRPERVPPSV